MDVANVFVCIMFIDTLAQAQARFARSAFDYYLTDDAVIMMQ